MIHSFVVLKPRDAEMIRTIAAIEAVQEFREAAESTNYEFPRNRHERRKAAALARRAAR